MRFGGQVQTIVAAVRGQFAQMMPRPAGQVLRQVTDVLVAVVPRGHHIEVMRQFTFGAMKLADRHVELHREPPVHTISVTPAAAPPTVAGTVPLTGADAVVVGAGAL